jgi:hypothetical protein
LRQQHTRPISAAMPITVRHPVLRPAMLAFGVALIVAAPLVGVLPGPGGIVVFAIGLSLVLRHSRWARRRYVRLKRQRPKLGAWADWGMRRPSERRRRRRAVAD